MIHAYNIIETEINYKVKKVAWLTFYLVSLFVCLSFTSFTLFWSTITLCGLTHCQYNESIHRKEQLASRNINKISVKNVCFFQVYFCEAMDLMQRRPRTF